MLDYNYSGGYGPLRRAVADYLLAALQPRLGPYAHISGAEQGLHLCVRLPPTLDDKALAQRLGELGLTVRALSAYCLQRTDAKGLVIGYDYATLTDIAHYGPLVAQAIAGALACLTPKA